MQWFEQLSLREPTHTSGSSPDDIAQYTIKNQGIGGTILPFRTGWPLQRVLGSETGHIALTKFHLRNGIEPVARLSNVQTTLHPEQILKSDLAARVAGTTPRWNCEQLIHV
jgi:hypothetical protein